jgi:hypothetical protein
MGTADPVFNDRRLNLLLRVAETLASGTASAAAKADSTPTGGLATASNFFLLQPTLVGLGIDFNEMLEHLARKDPMGQS